MRIITVVCALLVIVNVGLAATVNPTTCVETYDPNVDYFPVKTTVTYAQDFEIIYNNSFKVVSNAESGEVYVLYQCGTPAPNASLFAPNAKFFSIPVQTVWTLDTSAITFVEVLGKIDSIVVVSYVELITSPCIIQKHDAGTVVDRDSYNTTLLSNPGVDVMFGFYGSSTYATAVATNSQSDPGIRNSAEWAKFYATFFNLEHVANNISDFIIGNIDCYQQNFPSIANATYSPVIAYASLSFSGDSWVFSNAHYKQQLVEYSGGTFYYTSTTFTTIESFLEASKNIDVLIDETYFTSLPNVTQALGTYRVTVDDVAEYKWIRNFFREDGIVTSAYGFDWFTAAAVMKDAVLTDVLNIVNSSLPTPNYQRKWLRNVTAEEAPQVMTADRCDSGNILDLSTRCASLIPATTTTTTTTASTTNTTTTTSASASSTSAATTTTTTTPTAGSATTSDAAKSITTVASLVVLLVCAVLL